MPRCGRYDDAVKTPGDNADNTKKIDRGSNGPGGRCFKAPPLTFRRGVERIKAARGSVFNVDSSLAIFVGDEAIG